jgi:hypothetical protein
MPVQLVAGRLRHTLRLTVQNTFQPLTSVIVSFLAVFRGPVLAPALVDDIGQPFPNNVARYDGLRTTGGTRHAS